MFFYLSLPTRRILILFFVVVCSSLSNWAAAAAPFGFVPGSYYTSHYSSNSITEYNAAGDQVATFTLPSSYGSEVRGLTFGTDNLLYAAVVTSTGFSVLALNSSGVPQKSYSGSVYIQGNLSYGKIAIAGPYLYVAGQNQLTRFLLGNPSSGTYIYTNNQVFDVAPLPNGNLFVASAYHVEEITTAGAVVRALSLSGIGGSILTDIRGIEYNRATNDLFLTEIGYDDHSFQLMRFDATSGALEKNATFGYGDDIFLTLSGRLLVGSTTESPNFFDQDLNVVGTLHGGQQTFVTQFVPEPSTIALIPIAAALGVFGGRKAHRKPGRLLSSIAA